MTRTLLALAAAGLIAPGLALAQGQNGKGFGFEKYSKGECERAISRFEASYRREGKEAPKYECRQNADGTFTPVLVSGSSS